MTTEQCFVIPEDAVDIEPAPAQQETIPEPEAKTSAVPDKKTLAAFAVFILFGGAASVAIRITYAELEDLVSAWDMLSQPHLSIQVHR